MHRLIALLFIFLFSCKDPAKQARNLEPAPAEIPADTLPEVVATDTMPALPEPPPVKNPEGIYSTTLTDNRGRRLQHIIRFNRDRSFSLQERYFENDSIIRVRGNWSPSRGFIWLYADQVVRARYRWSGNRLNYYNAATGRDIPMQSHPDAATNRVWSGKAKKGSVLYAIGNEPFWNVEHTGDSLLFQMAGWDAAVSMKTGETLRTGDSVVFTGTLDSLRMRVTVFPRFCSDGMSDYIYRNEVRVIFRENVYRGCGLLFK